MNNSQSVLCFSKSSRYRKPQVLDPEQAETLRTKFRKKIKNKRYRLIEKRELFQNQSVCALFHPENLQVLYFSEGLSRILPLFEEDSDFTGFQQIHDEIALEVLSKANVDHGVQLSLYWLLLLKLLENGFLQDKQSRRAISEYRQDQLPTNKLTSLVIIPSLDCNFSCNYCYYRGIPSSEKARATLSIDKIRQGIDYYLANNMLPKKFSRSLRLGGGEPLLFYELFKDTLEYTDEIRRREPDLAPFKIFMVTNASLIDDKWIQLIKKYKIGIGVSLDGKRSRNDIRRKSPKGSAFVKTTKGIEQLNRAGIRPSLVMTVSSHNIDNLSEDVGWLFDHFEFTDYSFNLDISFIEEYRVPPVEYTNAIFKAYDALSYKGLFDSKVAKINADFQAQRLTAGRCGGIFNHMVLFPDGRIGPCPSIVDDKKEGMKINEKQKFYDARLFKKWSAFDYTLNPICQKCNYFKLCEGYCPYSSMQTKGQMAVPNEYDCAYTKKRLEWLIWYDFEQLYEG